jgi:glycosyltransferase involved in cell wall biosynthesis
MPHRSTREPDYMTVKHPDASPVALSVIIKALNEEANIARTIEAALAETEGRAAEIILADSASTDRTVEIALGYPVKVVVLSDPAERSCGLGAQMGYQVARGRYVYVIDGDMEMLPGFLDRALTRLEADPGLAGVGGLIIEAYVPNADCARRDALVRRAAPSDARVGALYGGGVYRRSAIEHVGYLTNPNLHSNEELELGLRLGSAGWRLERLGIPSVRHYGHKLPDFEVHKLRWRTRYCWGLGELMKASVGRPYFREVVFQKNTLIYGSILGLWALLIGAVALGASPWLLPLVPAVMVLAMAARKRNFGHGLHAVINWHIWAFGTLGGWLRSQDDPRRPIAGRLISGQLIQHDSRATV